MRKSQSTFSQRRSVVPQSLTDICLSRVYLQVATVVLNDGCAKNHRAVKRHSTSLILSFIGGSRYQSGRDPLRKYSPSSKPARREEFYYDKNSLLGSTTWWPNAASSSSSR